MKLLYIFDIDGTLALRGDRSPYDWANVGLDTPNLAVVETYRCLYHFNQYFNFFIFSGRDEVCRPETEKWLKDNGIRYDRLLMRPEGNNQPDTEIKTKFFLDEVEDKYEVVAVFDDRDSVVKMWRSLGLTCFQVAEGNF